MELVTKEYLSHGMVARYIVKAHTQTNITPPLTVAGMVMCQFRTDVNIISSTDHRISISVKVEALCEDRVVSPKIRTQCFGVNTLPKEGGDGQMLQQLSDDSMTATRACTWQLKGTTIAKKPSKDYTLVFRIFVQLVLRKSNFHNLYDDTEITDFELVGDKSSVKVHRAVLAASSPVLKTMLSGQWRENTKGHIELAGITTETLNDFKQYLYMHVLPNGGASKSKDRERPNPMKSYNTRVEALLKLACYLMMSDLIEACTCHFLLHLTSQNAFKLLHLAGTYKLKHLMKGVMLAYKDGAIDIDEKDLAGDWM